jgi:hypothetical protein
MNNTSSNQQYDLNISLVNTIGEEVVLQSENLLTLSITESVLSLVPKFEMIINNVGGFVDRTPITDKSMLYISITNPNKVSSSVYSNEYIINAKFIVSGFYAMSDTFENKYLTYKISGYLALDDLFAPFHKQSFVGSSDQVLEQVCNEVNYTFDRRIRGTESNIWYQTGNNYQFMAHVADRSFIGGDGVFVYGTTNKQLVYTSINLESSRATAKVATYSKSQVENNFLGDDERNMYYDGYNIMNNAEMYNNTSNYGGYYSYYNLSDYVYDTIHYDNKLTDLYNINKKYVGKPSFSVSMGLITDESLFDTIYRGKQQNSFYRFALFSNTVLININNSTNVKLFDKIDLDLQSTYDGKDISSSYSGEYLVGAITTVIARDLPIAKKVMLCRYGMNSVKNSIIGDIV